MKGWPISSPQELDSVLVNTPSDELQSRSDAASHAQFERDLLSHRRLFADLEALREEICTASDLMARVLSRGRRLLVFGNGAAAAAAQQMAAQLTSRLHHERRPLAVIALSADGPLVTAIANDQGFTQVFARQLAGHARSGDCAIGISATGACANVLRAFEVARSLGVRTIGLVGRDGDAAAEGADLSIIVPHDDRARIHEAHVFILQTWCSQLELALGLVK